MSDCQDYPTVQTIQAFGKDAPCFTEIVTSNADRTTATASDGQTKKTIAAALREAGWVSVGEWSTNPTITEPNQYVFYNNQRFAPVSLPYTVNSATHPDPNALVPIELRDVSEFLTELQADELYSKKANGIYDMLANTTYEIGDKVSTGSTAWLITDSTRGWELDAGGIYALPLNGVFLTDLGADPNNGNDASSAFELAISRYDVTAKRRFTLVGSGGDFNVSRGIALSQGCSRFKFNGQGATITATANMDSIITWPSLSDVEIEDVTFKLGAGVTIANAVIDGGQDGQNGIKGLRTKLRNVRAFEIAGAPIFIRLTQEWEFKLDDIRSDHDVTGQTGTNIELMSCVNGQIKTPEVGYSAVGIKFSKSPNATYKCEGIDLISPVTTFAAIALKGDQITSLKVLGGVFDFCLTRAWEFTNGQDVSFFGTWFANRSDSSDSGTFCISQPNFSKIKMFGCHFVNNNTGNNWNALSLNSPNGKIIGCTSVGSIAKGLTLDGAEIIGNDFIPDSSRIAITDSQRSPAGNGNAAVKIMYSGENQFTMNKLIARNEWVAPYINQNAVWHMDTYSGNFADQVYVTFNKNGVENFRFDLILGNFEVSRPGKGIKLTSPDGLTTKTLTIDNSGNPVWS
ncbi:MAG: hypothetical protein GY774_20700 [Planctomycetes bacterium]|nr:hypothetical protein [Planctomycetota bacterium]